MSTAATLVVGADGSTTKGAISKGIGSNADRTVFLARRREVDVIIIGGNTARNEPYHFTPVPLVVISRSDLSPISNNPKAHIWNTTPGLAIERARQEFGPRILIEGGVSLINELLAQRLIDEFFLTVTPEREGENIFDWRQILTHFAAFEESQVDQTLFFHAYN
ncbi:MAG: dihydrofolate reductase family protein [Actinomycetota bacterium]|nr:dihydrofolate reductase family protein [Actinomycetota bacterium]